MKKLLITLMIGMFLINLGSASLGVFQEDTCVSLYQFCDDCTYVNLSNVAHPNGTVQTFNVAMTQDDVSFTHPFCDANKSGIYYYTVKGDKGGSVTTERLSFEVTLSGFTISESNAKIINSSFYIFLILAILCFVGAVFINTEKPQIRWTLFILGSIFFIIALNLVSIALADSLINEKLISFFDTITSISFIFYWGMFILLGVIWFITILNTILFKQKLNEGELFGDF